ncbi:MAG: DNA-binding NarL/FixJ family response regulator [Kiritimatiellia bacterium]|jgi:DNA-binding NarL/FixJ family response regulator
MNYSVVIVEDDEETRKHLCDTIDSAAFLTLIQSCASLKSAHSALALHKPDILLVDLGLPDGSGIDLILAIDELDLATEALVISGFTDEKHVFSALEAGAKGYLSKIDSEKDICQAILHMMDGGAPISPVIARLMLLRFNTFETKRPERESLSEPLTEKQKAILSYVSKGFTSREIAGLLDISYYTVTTHVKNIYRKLHVNSRAEALFEATQLGLINSTGA